MPGTDRPPLRIGLVLDWVHGPEVPAAQQWDEHVALIEEGRRWGLSMVTSGQHFLPEGLRFYQPIPYLSAMAMRFPDLRVATAVLLLPLLHPVEVAEQVATLDAVSGGRVVCGVGLGYTDREFELFGIQRAERGRRLEESVGILRALWSGEPVDHDGEFYRVQAKAPVVLPVQRPGPPVWVGGGAEASARRAARCGDAYYPPPFVSHDELRRLYGIHTEARQTAGRGSATQVPIRRDLYIAGSSVEAAERIEPFVNGRTRTYLEWGLGNEAEKSATLSEDAVSELGQRLLLGTPEQVAAGLTALRDDIGMTDFVLRLQWPGMPHEEALEQLRRFGEEVLPLVG